MPFFFEPFFSCHDMDFSAERMSNKYCLLFGSIYFFHTFVIRKSQCSIFTTRVLCGTNTAAWFTSTFFNYYYLFSPCGLKKTTFCVVCYKQWSRKMTAIKLDRISSFLPKNSCTSFQHYSNIFSDLHWPSAMFYCFQGHTLMEQAEYMRMECVYLFIATLVYRKISFDGKKSNGTFLGVSCQYSGIFCKIKNSF